MPNDERSLERRPRDIMKVCPRCGATDDQKEFVGPFCIDCFPLKLKVPREVVIEQCKHCGRIKIRGQWQEGDIWEEVVRHIKGDFSSWYVDETGRLILVFEKQGRVIERPVDVRVRIARVLCDRCAGLQRKSWQAKIQLREPAALKLADRIVRKASKRTWAWKEHLREGVDVFVGDAKEAVRVLNELKLGYKLTKKLVGMKDGQRVYKSTFRVKVGYLKTNKEKE